ncbi:hypothetical protein ACCO45_008431 [Purpureocillium lilacinum]|uniref:Uncharacterized protein n=1 Tax=Purpureocillium lilacinum TaxID=33203 RepID=A0ACC4DP05_PURLI
MEHLPLGRRIHADRRGHGTGLDGENATLRLGERTLTVAGSVVPHPQAPEPGSIFCPGRNSEDRTRVPSTRTPTVHLPGSQASNPRSAGVKCRGSTSPAGICIASSSSNDAGSGKLSSGSAGLLMTSVVELGGALDPASRFQVPCGWLPRPPASSTTIH